MGGGVKEYSFNSKKIVLSLATISFLASQAHANGTGSTDACTTASTRSGSSGSTGSTYNCTITGTSNGITLSDRTISNVTIQSNGTIEASNNGPAISLKGSNSTNYTLEKLINQGTIKGKIEIENKDNSFFTGTITVRTFENSGFIQGKVGMQVNTDSNTGSVIVHTFHNKSGGTIDGRVYYGWSNKGSISIENFNNEGTITNTTNNNENIAVNFEKINATIQTFKNSGSITSEKGQGVKFEGNVKINTFENTGTIEGKDGQGVYFEGENGKSPHVTLFNNEGFISGSCDMDNDKCKKTYSPYYFYSGGGVSMAGSTIETFKNSGTIQGTGKANNPAGVKLIRATVNTFENTGLISGLIGILATGGTIETFKNSGTIESTSPNGIAAAIKIRAENNNPFSITHFTNTGTIKSASNGVLIESGDKIGTLTNKGTIETQLNGIGFYNYRTNGPEETHLGKIVLEEGSSIKAGNNGINIDNQTTARSIRVGGIEVKAGASVSGGEAGIYLGESKEITAPITISGTVSGGNAGIVNEGSITAPITISGTVSGGNAGIVNESEGRMARGIVHDGEDELVISNQGLVGEDDKGNTVANNGSGSVRIKEWLVTTDESTHRLRTVHVGGSNTANVKVNSITVDQSGLDINELNDIKNIISGVSTNNIADSVKTNGGGEISLSYDPISARLSTDVQLNASIAGANFRSSVATASKRATFIDNVMANAMQSFSLDSSGKSQKIALSEKGNLYADASDYIASDYIKNDYIKSDYIKNDYIKSDLTQANYGSNKEHALFILPYLSSQSVELSLNEESKGHTKGTIIGYSTLKDSGIYGVYAGYEDTKMDSTYFDVNNISYYAGLKYFNTLFTTAKGQEVYIKAQAQAALIKNDFTKRIGKNEAKASAHSYTYGINTALGMNFIADKNIFSPEAGFAYEGSYTEAFSMQDTRGRATVQGGERTYANHLNLFSTKTSFTWFRDWLPNLKTSVELGAKFNVNPKVKARARFGNMKVNDEFHLPRVRKFASTSLIVPVNEAFYFSLNYNGMFDEKGNTHTGFAQFNYLW
ncbi:autotransporter outer membrane beta-barrel domain-containing protein [Campylobacter jejuni]|nr:autotransporter outer membrane beta-barrel domain-containing protein [Campylobacter jejuni]QYH12289.1 autotransporter outer membrane beta-barrel domain-containing protein [Campylobacter jejuni]SUX00177.1 autotransporter beta-domain-containing protein [Campylobacter jejuni subsp. doylei]